MSQKDKEKFQNQISNSSQTRPVNPTHQPTYPFTRMRPWPTGRPPSSLCWPTGQTPPPTIPRWPTLITLPCARRAILAQHCILTTLAARTHWPPPSARPRAPLEAGSATICSVPCLPLLRSRLVIVVAARTRRIQTIPPP
jgi:hypothetical protein